jgi:hypothetical protein
MRTYIVVHNNEIEGEAWPRTQVLTRYGQMFPDLNAAILADEEVGLKLMVFRGQDLKLELFPIERN